MVSNSTLVTNLVLERIQKGASLPQSIELDKTDIDQIAAFAAALYEEGKLESSLKLLEGLTSLCPDKAEYWTALGAVLTRIERHEHAISVLTLAIRLNPKNTSALVNRGECYLALAENEKAAADLGNAIDLDPRQEDQASNRARQLVYGMYTFFHECIEEGLTELEVEEDENRHG